MKAIKFVTLLFLSLSFFQASAQVRGLIPVWGRGSTSVNNRATGEGYDVAIDAAGNSYLSGWSMSDSSLNFGPYGVSTPIPTSGTSGISLLAKYSPSGQVQWAAAIPYLWNQPGPMAIDAAGNIFIFGSGTGAIGGNTTYVLKLNTNGVCTWVDSGITWGPHDVTTDANGNVYFAGYGYRMDKYSNMGNLQWTRTSSNPNNPSTATAIAQNVRGDVYIGGLFNEYISGGFNRNFVIGTDTLYSTFTPWTGSAFVAKYDTSGNVYWGRSLLSPTYVNIVDICTDNRGNVWVYGSFTDSLFLGDNLIANGQSIRNLFVVKLSESGDLLWVRTSTAINYQGVSGYNYFSGYQIVCDNSGRSYICGGMYESIYSVGDSLIYSPFRSGYNDSSFVLTYDSIGHIICFQPFPHGGDDWNAIAIDPSGYVFLGGDYFCKSNFILGADTLPGSWSQSNENLFIAKFSPCSGDIGPKGITELTTNSSGITLHPNPSNGFTTVSYNITGESGEATLYIKDLLGREISSSALQNTSGELRINTPSVKAGIYIVSLVSQGQVVATSKLLVE